MSRMLFLQLTIPMRIFMEKYRDFGFKGGLEKMP